MPHRVLDADPRDELVHPAPTVLVRRVDPIDALVVGSHGARVPDGQGEPMVVVTTMRARAGAVFDRGHQDCASLVPR